MSSVYILDRGRSRSLSRGHARIRRSLVGLATLSFFACADEESSASWLRNSSPAHAEGALQIFCDDPENPGYIRACEDFDQVAGVYVRSYDPKVVEIVRSDRARRTWHLRLVADGDHGVAGDEFHVLYEGRASFRVEALADDGALEFWLPWDWFCGLPDAAAFRNYRASVGISAPPRNNAVAWFSDLEVIGQSAVLWPVLLSACDETPQSQGFARALCTGRRNDLRCDGERPSEVVFVVEDALLWELTESAMAGQELLSRLEVDIYDYQSGELVVADTHYDRFDVAKVAVAANGSWARVSTPLSKFRSLQIRRDWGSPFDMNSPPVGRLDRHATGYITGARLSVQAIDRFFETEFVVGGDPELLFWPPP